MSEALSRPDNDLYQRDLYAWTQEQATRLRARARTDNARDVDWDNAAEEIESLGDSQRNEIENRLNVLVMHLLKWMYQPSQRSSNWKGMIVEQRNRLRRRFARSSSLRSYPLEVLSEEYESARLSAAGETNLAEEVLPTTCPFTAEEILDPDFYPEAQ